MPYRKKTTKRVKRKPKRRYRLSYNNGIPAGMPHQRVAKLRYVEEISATSTAGGLQTWVWSANSAYDPYYSGVGHQPMGFDTWTSLYNHYVVLGSKCTVQYTPSTNPSNATYVGCYLTDSFTPPYSTYTSFMESQKGSTKIVPRNSTDNTVVQQKFSAKNFFNVTDVKDNIARLGAAVNTNPTEGAYYMCWVQTVDGDTQVMNLVVMIDYIVSFSEPKDLAQS